MLKGPIIKALEHILISFCCSNKKETPGNLPSADLSDRVLKVNWICLFVCVEISGPSQTNGVMSSAISLPINVKKIAFGNKAHITD